LLAKRGRDFPAKLGATLDALVKLLAREPRAGEPAAVEAAARRDALQGLGRLCAAAAQQRADELVARAAEHLLRCGRAAPRPPARSAPRPPAARRAADAARPRRRSQRVHDGSRVKAVADAAGSMDGAQPWAPPPDSEAVCIVAALEAAFRACPHAVLAACLAALRKGHGELCGGARHLLTRHLLSARGPEAGAVGEAAQACLVASVLASRPGERARLREAVVRFKAGVRCAGARAC